MTRADLALVTNATLSLALAVAVACVLAYSFFQIS